ncbi:glycosyl hydrolase [Actinoplanes sp. NPDC023801]|uniref:glycoside hydrolase family 26 protein n=1 Tax=Actinoplanes sp. NPDC023801 TaxID=3154595 RepID=UPI0033E47DF3
MKRRQLLSLAGLTGLAACGTEAEPPAPVPAAAPPSPSPAATSPSPGPTAASPAPPASPALPAPAGDARGGAVPAPGGTVMLGSYLALGRRTLRQSLALRRGQLGREQRIVHRFYPWDEYVPASEPDIAGDSVLMVSWHGAPWAGILDGGSDANIRSVAAALKGMRRPILLRWGWEMNGDWFAWSGARNGRDAGDYVKVWRRLHRVFAGEGVTNVSWVWSPNWNSSPAESWNRVQRYYPGDDYVDWVGISGYNFYDESPATLFHPVTAMYGSRKPIILSETAAVRDRTRYIKRLRSWVEDTPQVGAVVWFDTDIQEGTDHNFRFDTDDASLAAYRAMARSPRFAG